MIASSYFRQSTMYSCGAASMQMLLEPFGIRKSEKQIGRMLHTNKISGTKPEMFPKIAEKYGFNYSVKRYATIKDLKDFIKNDYLIMVSYYYVPYDTDHYSVVRKIWRKRIYLLDPLAGPDKEYSLSYFEKLWKGKDKDEPNWLFALKK
jgi:ABC-type bacteriocin/lantibiotic exporter with double-glycine peptidase domain